MFFQLSPLSISLIIPLLSHTVSSNLLSHLISILQLSHSSCIYKSETSLPFPSSLSAFMILIFFSYFLFFFFLSFCLLSPFLPVCFLILSNANLSLSKINFHFFFPHSIRSREKKCFACWCHANYFCCQCTLLLLVYVPTWNWRFTIQKLTFNSLISFSKSSSFSI